MRISELRDALAVFNQTMPVEVATPEQGKPHTSRAITTVGHVWHPGEVKDDPAIHMVDIICDHWDRPANPADKVQTVSDLMAALTPYPPEMGVRVTMPIDHDDISHRLLDVVMVGRVVGSQTAGPIVQLVTEAWDFPSWLIVEKPHVAAARATEYERVATSVPPGEAA